MAEDEIESVEPAGPRTVASYTGLCGGCGFWVEIGEQIRQKPNGEWVHVGC
jgi:hypothetical protein